MGQNALPCIRLLQIGHLGNATDLTIWRFGRRTRTARPHSAVAGCAPAVPCVQRGSRDAYHNGGVLVPPRLRYRVSTMTQARYTIWLFQPSRLLAFSSSAANMRSTRAPHLWQLVCSALTLSILIAGLWHFAPAFPKSYIRPNSMSINPVPLKACPPAPRLLTSLEPSPEAGCGYQQPCRRCHSSHDR